MSRRLLPTLALLAALVALPACEEQSEPPIADPSLGDMDADQVMVGLEHFITVDGVRRGLLVADTAFLYEDSATVRVRPVDLTLYDEGGTVVGEVTSREGLLNTRTERMTAIGDVVVTSTQEGQRIETEQLHFDPHRDRLWSDVATTIHRNGSVLRGSGFESDTRLDDVRLRNPQGRVEGLEFEL